MYICERKQLLRFLAQHTSKGPDKSEVNWTYRVDDSRNNAGYSVHSSTVRVTYVCITHSYIDTLAFIHTGFAGTARNHLVVPWYTVRTSRFFSMLSCLVVLIVVHTVRTVRIQYVCRLLDLVVVHARGKKKKKPLMSMTVYVRS